MKAGVITFPGSNCDRDLLQALERVIGRPAVSLWHKDHDLQNCDAVFVPGGFSYGDYLRPGAIARFSPIMKAVAKFEGKVVGICNGFQILTEAGLLPGALLRNVSTRFVCKNVEVIPASGRMALRKNRYTLPIAHADGRYYCSADELKRMEDNGQVVFRYQNNPNGSVGDVAGVSNASGNVVAMMPHPERAADPALSNTDGIEILRALLSR